MAVDAHPVDPQMSQRISRNICVNTLVEGSFDELLGILVLTLRKKPHGLPGVDQMDGVFKRGPRSRRRFSGRQRFMMVRAQDTGHHLLCEPKGLRTTTRAATREFNTKIDFFKQVHVSTY